MVKQWSTCWFMVELWLSRVSAKRFMWSHFWTRSMVSQENSKPWFVPQPDPASKPLGAGEVEPARLDSQSETKFPLALIRSSLLMSSIRILVAFLLQLQTSPESIGCHLLQASVGDLTPGPLETFLSLHWEKQPMLSRKFLLRMIVSLWVLWGTAVQDVSVDSVSRRV